MIERRKILPVLATLGAMAGLGGVPGLGEASAAGPSVVATKATPASGAAGPARKAGRGRLSEQLSSLRGQIVTLEKSLIVASKNQAKIQAHMKNLQTLIRLQREERELCKQRLEELQKTVAELEDRRKLLNERIVAQEKAIRGFLVAMERSAIEADIARHSHAFQLQERERFEGPRRKLLANLTSRAFKEIEILKVDLADADHLEGRIQEEKHQLAYLFQEQYEKESILELNQQIQAELLEKQHVERLTQLENYRRLKSSEAQVESLISQFNARIELERTTEAERQASRAMAQGVFAGLKGKLPLPVSGGKVLSAFGRAFDPRSRLYIFKKGIEISTERGKEVRAISAGKVVYSGSLPDYGQVTIIDHGEQYYSLCAHLGELRRKAGDAVAAGDVVGITDDLGTPVYFEIRARNVAVNPLQWVLN